MIHSNIDTDNSDLLYIKTNNHIEKLWNTIEKNISSYFKQLIKGEFSKHCPMSVQAYLDEIFKIGLNNYKQIADKYIFFFTPQKMQEWEDDEDADGFKQALTSYVPIIRKALNSKEKAIEHWKRLFQAPHNAEDIYETFSNLMTFYNEFKKIHQNTKAFSNINDLASIEKLLELDTDNFIVIGVIGMGIKSTVLYFLDPQYFLRASKITLFGFYVLSDGSSYNLPLPTGTNEFIMIKEEKKPKKPLKVSINQNYWYPYDLFTLYALRTYRLLKDLCGQQNYLLEDENRFVYVNRFMELVFELNKNDIDKLTANNEKEEI